MLNLLLVLSITMFGFTAYADGDEEGIFKRWFETKKNGVSAVKFQQYNDLCGSCHFPYQPGLLPALSWEKIMTNLDNHFGQSVKMTVVETITMTRYVLDNSAGHVNDEVSNKMLQSLKYNPVPVRITETPYFVYKHHHLDNALVNKVQLNNLQLNNNVYEQGFSQCDNCHQGAIQGNYNELKMKFPANGQWNTNHADLKM